VAGRPAPAAVPRATPPGPGGATGIAPAPAPAAVESAVCITDADAALLEELVSAEEMKAALPSRRHPAITITPNEMSAVLAAAMASMTAAAARTTTSFVPPTASPSAAPANTMKPLSPDLLAEALTEALTAVTARARAPVPRAHTHLFSWGYPEEEMFAALHGLIPINLKPATTIPFQILDPDVGEVFVCGTYFDNIDSVLETCPGAKVTVLAHLAAELDARKYGDACEYRLLANGFPYDRYPWMLHIIRRSTRDALPVDEHFYRGMVHTGKGAPFHQQMRRIIEGALPAEVVMTAGVTISDHIEALASYQVSSSSRMMRVAGHLATVVPGAWTPVRPIIEEAAKYSDLGIIMRFNLATLCTHFTFFTYRTAVDLEFVLRPPFNGEGDQPYMSAKIPGLVTIIPGKTLEECVEAALLMSAATDGQLDEAPVELLNAAPNGAAPLPAAPGDAPGDVPLPAAPGAAQV
jgi:hypothetical protein